MLDQVVWRIVNNLLVDVVVQGGGRNWWCCMVQRERVRVKLN